MPVTDVAHEAVEATTEPRRPRLGRSADNALVRGVARIPLPLGTKLLLGFAIVAALLALVAVLGLVSLSQSNSRGEQLKSLQQTNAYALLLKEDANELSTLVGDRQQRGPDLLSFYQAEDQAILNFWDRPTQDAQTLERFNPHAGRELQATLQDFWNTWGTVVVKDQTRKGASSPALGSALVRASMLSIRAYEQAFSLEQTTTAKEDALVASNRNGFVEARNLLIGVGAGSLLLALAFGLLLSWSVVGPLRRTQARLSEIAGGDFGAHVEVPNRDEIGALARDVNRMNDELGRLYGELETASRHKSDFLATMSHELRTPLNAIIGFSEVLHEQMFGELNERQLAYVNDVIEAGKHLLLLINDVLDLAKIEAGRMELEISEVALPELLRSAVSMHSESAARDGVALALTTEPDEIAIAADQRRVRQIVFKLVSNAVKFTPADGRVDISARIDDGHVEIAVADTGPGISATDQETIFEEFEQTSDGKKAEGTGLGLPLSRKLVELHGGRLWVESDLGKGSTFRFTLPVRQEAAT